MTVIVIFSNMVFANTLNNNENESANPQERIDNIGFRILNSNGIEHRIVFSYNSSKTENAYTNSRNRQVILNKGLYSRLSSDDEIAVVLSHEISHAIDSYNGIFRGAFSHMSYSLSPKKYEYKADKRAVDFMVNAGYNPVAFIVTMNKIAPQRRYDWCSKHPLTSKRLMEVYEYIYKKYPEYLVNNAYKESPFYQNFLLTSRDNRAKFKKKIEQKSKSSEYYK